MYLALCCAFLSHPSLSLIHLALTLHIVHLLFTHVHTHTHKLPHSLTYIHPPTHPPTHPHTHTHTHGLHTNLKAGSKELSPDFGSTINTCPR
jgi:hypothetical protein